MRLLKYYMEKKQQKAERTAKDTFEGKGIGRNI